MEEVAFLLEERFGGGEIEAGQGMPAVETGVNRGPEGPKGGLVGGGTLPTPPSSSLCLSES